MKFKELLAEQVESSSNLIQMLGDFLPMAMKELDLKELPRFKLMLRVPSGQQPTFGRYEDSERVIYLAIEDRHPLDVIRTLAHELVHFKQGTEHELEPTSGHTGSPQENEAHELAGIIMRHFDKKFPKYFNAPAINIQKNTLP